MAPQPDSSQNLEGKHFNLKDVEQLNQVIELAFDYRGDVTLALQSGERLEGYVYHRSEEASPPSLKIFPKNQDGTREIRYDEIAAITFSGEDTAFGKSWDDWLKKKPGESGKK